MQGQDLFPWQSPWPWWTRSWPMAPWTGWTGSRSSSRFSPLPPTSPPPVRSPNHSWWIQKLRCLLSILLVYLPTTIYQSIYLLSSLSTLYIYYFYYYLSCPDFPLCWYLIIFDSFADPFHWRHCHHKSLLPWGSTTWITSKLDCYWILSEENNSLLCRSRLHKIHPKRLVSKFQSRRKSVLLIMNFTNY